MKYFNPMKAIFFSCLVIFAHLTSQAKEGFNSYLPSLPKSMQPWIQKTFLVHTDKDGLHFVTARHVVMDSCPGIQTCTLRLGASWKLDSHENGEYQKSGFESEITLNIKEILVFEQTSKDWKSAGYVNDLAYIKAEMNSRVVSANIEELGFSVLKQLPEHSVFQRFHVVLGYPGWWKRYSLTLKNEPNVLSLRWSEGQFLEERKSGDKFYIATDSDSIGGNSGGPVLFEDGTLVGILYGGPSTLKYFPFPTMISYIVPVDYVRLMVGKILLKQASMVPICEFPHFKAQATCQL